MLQDLYPATMWQGVCSAHTATGQQFWADIAVQVITIDAEELILARITDVSERIVIEAALKRTGLLLDHSQSIARIGGWEIDIET